MGKNMYFLQLIWVLVFIHSVFIHSELNSDKITSIKDLSLDELEKLTSIKGLNEGELEQLIGAIRWNHQNVSDTKDMDMDMDMTQTQTYHDRDRDRGSNMPQNLRRTQSELECSIGNGSIYDSWLTNEYIGPLAIDPAFWRYQHTRKFELTNGLALELGL